MDKKDIYQLQNQRKISQYCIGSLIGKGGFAKVFKTLETFTNQTVAAKVITIDDRLPDQMQRIRQEAQILRTLDHPNIVRIYETMETESHYVLFLEYVKGKELFDYIVDHGCLQQEKAARIFHQIVLAIDYLHKKGIVHRDIKSKNIMIDKNLNIKLIDFGIAAYIKESDTFLTTFCGSAFYLAPQIIQNKNYDGRKVDIWCLGVTLYKMLEGELPFDELDSKNDNFQLNQKIKMMKYQNPIISSPQAKELYSLIFKKSEQRIDISKLLNSKFFMKYNLASYQIQNEPLIGQQREKNLIVRSISANFNIPKASIEYQINNKILGRFYALYHLLRNKKTLRQYECFSLPKTLDNKRRRCIESLQQLSRTKQQQSILIKQNPFEPPLKTSRQNSQRRPSYRRRGSIFEIREIEPLQPMQPLKIIPFCRKMIRAQNHKFKVSKEHNHQNQQRIIYNKQSFQAKFLRNIKEQLWQ